jgi:LysM repeat protein
VARLLTRALLALALVATLVSPETAHAELVRVPCVLAESESVEAVATRFHVSMDDLALLNEGVDLTHATAGTELVVGFAERIEHRVVRGDTLLRLGRRYGVSVDDITRWNAIADAARVRAGATLVIYVRPAIPPSASIGRPSDGSLERGVRLRPSPGFVVHDPSRAFVTRDVASWMADGFAAVARRYPSSSRVEVRDASLEHGGRLREHRSHQTGRDIDLVYFQDRCRETCAFHRVNPDSLDAERQWALLEAWLRAGVVEYVFIDHALQAPLYEAARAAGATREELSRWFQYPRDEEQRYGVIRHVRGHRDHLHVRFVCAAHDLRCDRATRTHDDHEDETEADDPS